MLLDGLLVDHLPSLISLYSSVPPDLVFISSSGNKVPGHLHLLSLFSSSFTEVLLDLKIEAGAITALSLPFPLPTIQSFYR